MAVKMRTYPVYYQITINLNGGRNAALGVTMWNV